MRISAWHGQVLAVLNATVPANKSSDEICKSYIRVKRNSPHSFLITLDLNLILTTAK